jgi:hypothetical protein
MRYLVSVAAAALVLATAVSAGAQGKPKMPHPDAGGVVAAPNVPAGETALGTIRLPRAVTADGKPLRAGTYRVRLTAEQAQPNVVGQTAPYERWVEFTQNGEVKGREVVSIVPPSEIGKVAEDRAPAAGGSKVEMLKGNDYIRVWINRGGVHYLIHLVPA